MRLPVAQDLLIKSRASAACATTGGNSQSDRTAGTSGTVSIPMLGSLQHGMERPFSDCNKWKSWNTQPSIPLLPQTLPFHLAGKNIIHLKCYRGLLGDPGTSVIVGRLFSKWISHCSKYQHIQPRESRFTAMISQSSSLTSNMHSEVPGSHDLHPHTFMCILHVM